jgi:hypothetical protein
MTTASTRVGLPVRTRHLPTAALVAIFIAAAIVIMHAGRDTTFFFDEWNFIQSRLGWRPHVLLYPHNEHLSLLPVLVYKILFETVGLNHYGVYRAVAVGFNFACGALLFVYVRRRLGDWPAVGLTACLVLMGASAQDIIWPFQIGFLGSMAAGIGALLCLDRRTFRGDVLACFLTCVSLSSSSQGLFFLLAIAIDVLMRDDRVRRLWVAGVPAVLYLLWYLKYGTGHISWGRIPQIPDHVYGGLSIGSSAATGTPDSFGAPLAIGLIAAVLFALSRGSARLPRLIMVTAMPLAFFALTVLARGLTPVEPRYIYPTAIFVVLLASEALRDFVLTGFLAVALGVLLCFGALGKAQGLNSFGDTLRGDALGTRASLTAGEILIDRLDPQTVPDPVQPQLHIGPYDHAARQYGSTVAWTPQQLVKRTAAERGAVDAALIRLIGPYPAPAPPNAPSGCNSYAGDNKRQESPVGKQLYVKAGARPVDVSLKRFGNFGEQPQVQVTPNTAAIISVPTDRATRPWTAAVRSAAPFTACPQ